MEVAMSADAGAGADHGLPRVEALRAELARRGLFAFIVPRADEFQLSHQPPSSERLLWLSGFSGSAGVAIVTRETAGLFVDGRYTLQAHRQAGTEHWQHQHLARNPPDRWLAEQLHPGAVVGFDPRLHTPEGVALYRKAADAAGATLQAVAANPIDELWTDRPQPPSALLELYPEALAGVSRADKIARAAEQLRNAKLHASVITDPTCLMWLLNVRGGDISTLPVALGYGILFATGDVHLFVAASKLTAATREALHVDLGERLRVATPEEFAVALEAIGAKPVLVDQPTVNQWTIERLQAGGAMPVPGRDVCALAKATKNAAELAGIRAAHVRDAVALVRYLAWFDATAPGGFDEWTAAQQLDTLRAEGETFRGLSFRTISAAGPNSAQPHYSVTPEIARPLKQGEIYLVDSGAQYIDGTTDVTRTTVMGDASPEMKRRYTQVLKGHLCLGAARFPAGTTGSQLDPLARQFLWHEGVDYDHGTGHGVGAFLAVHEGPQNIGKQFNPVPLQPGMVLSNEPGFYKDGAFGIRIENLVTVKSAEPQPEGALQPTLCFETLTLVPYERKLIDVSLLSDREQQLVDAYHQRVRAEIGPLLSSAEPAQGWLQAATEPLNLRA
jgi:Xaa-Pro aminopeptidase